MTLDIKPYLINQSIKLLLYNNLFITSFLAGIFHTLLIIFIDIKLMTFLYIIIIFHWLVLKCHALKMTNFI